MVDPFENHTVTKNVRRILLSFLIGLIIHSRFHGFKCDFSKRDNRIECHSTELKKRNCETAFQSLKLSDTYCCHKVSS